MTLNPPQLEAVNTLKGPLLVLAGAGTGKTRVVTYRIARLIQTGIRPERILAVTFTNKAAAEMQERAAKLLKARVTERPEISTFHSLCVRILRRHIQLLGYPEKFAICDRGDQESFARAALRQIKVPGEVLRPGDLLSLVSRWKSASISPAQSITVAETDKEHLAASAYRRYQKDLKASGMVDFDDLLLLTEELYQKFPDIRRQDAQRYDHLLVDEYQDTNGSQYRIVKAIASGHRNLCVVGDDDQSIYAWRGAEVTHILNFKRDWPEAKVVRLEDNYRSTAAILTLANRLIACNKHRHDKVLKPARGGGEPPRIRQFKDEDEEAAEVVKDLKQRLSEEGIEPRDFAILFRTNQQPRAFEMELRKAGVPYVLIGGMSFYDRKEIRDVLAYLRLLAHQQDEIALLRIINKPPRGISQPAVTALTAQAVAESKPLWDVLGTAKHQVDISAAGQKAIAAFQSLIERYAALAETGSLVDMTRQLLVEIKYRQEIARLYPNEEDQQNRWDSVEELLNALGRYEAKKKSRKQGLAGFLDEVALAEQDQEEDKESQLNRNAVALMTLHAAKGLEFPQVYLVGMEETILPHKRSIVAGDESIDEERRLCYVGITRAQDRLTLSLALTRMMWGKPRETEPSRFLFEITGKPYQPAASGTRPAQRERSGRPVKKRAGSKRKP